MYVGGLVHSAKEGYDLIVKKKFHENLGSEPYVLEEASLRLRE